MYYITTADEKIDNPFYKMDYRESIGGIFLTNIPDHTTNSDVWEVDVRGLPVEDDPTSVAPAESPEEQWYVVYQDIPPSRIKLISK